MIKAFIGLGNPGKEYLNTRHNIGFTVIDDVLKALNIKNFKEKYFSHVYKFEDKFFLKPQTFMNNSGIAVKQFLYRENITPEEILVIHDDLDLPLGHTKIKLGGSSGGQRGILSIINELKTENFYRLKIGIGRPTSKSEVSDYVLSHFDPSQIPHIKKAISKASECIIRIIKGEELGKVINFCNTN